VICPSCKHEVEATGFCSNCGAALAPSLGPGLAPSMGAGCGVAAGGFFAGLGINVVILVTFFAFAGSGGVPGSCVGGRITFGIIALIALAIPVAAVVRIRGHRTEWPFWAGLIVATYAPFLPCTLSMLSPSLRGTAC
jgi:hypothetical protein